MVFDVISQASQRNADYKMQIVLVNYTSNTKKVTKWPGHNLDGLHSDQKDETSHPFSYNIDNALLVTAHN